MPNYLRTGLALLLFSLPKAWAEPVMLQELGSYRTGIFDSGGAEIVAFDPASQKMFVTNAALGGVDIVNISNPANPQKTGFIDIVGLGLGAGPTSVASKGGLLAIAVPAVVKTDLGSVVFTDAAGTILKTTPAGALPDMVTFSPDGLQVLVANEGEPNDAYTIDPPGTVTIIDLQQGVAQAVSTTVGFTAWDGKETALRGQGVRIFGPNASASQDLEPEYIAVSPDSKTAFVTLQENNAMAIIDIPSRTVKRIKALGYKNHNLPGNGLDPSNRDSGIAIANWPVQGMYQPDAIAAFSVAGETFTITANEGDARDYDGFSEESRIGSLNLGLGLLNSNPGIQANAALGRLNSTTEPPSGKKVSRQGDIEYQKLYAYGARSFSIWNSDGAQVFDSGDALEQITAAALPLEFNSTNDENETFDGRSDDKGPEPEAVAVGEIGVATYAFIGLERIGGIVVYNVSNPYAPTFESYVNNRDFDGDPENDTAGDLGPEGVLFIPAAESPTGVPLVAVSNEISGSTTIFSVLVP